MAEQFSDEQAVNRICISLIRKQADRVVEGLADDAILNRLADGLRKGSLDIHLVAFGPKEEPKTPVEE